MKKIVQIMPWPEGWEAVFFSYDDGELFCEPVLFWALVSETPMLAGNLGVTPYASRLTIYGRKFTPCAMLYALCDFLINTRLPEKYRREQMEYFKKEGEDLMRMRKSGHLPTIEPEIPR